MSYRGSRPCPGFILEKVPADALPEIVAFNLVKVEREGPLG